MTVGSRNSFVKLLIFLSTHTHTNTYMAFFWHCSHLSAIIKTDWDLTKSNSKYLNYLPFSEKELLKKDYLTYFFFIIA